MADPNAKNIRVVMMDGDGVVLDSMVVSDSLTIEAQDAFADFADTYGVIDDEFLHVKYPEASATFNKCA